MAQILKSKYFLLGGDIVIFFLSFFISLFIRHREIFSYQYFNQNLIKFSILLIIWLFVFYILNLYHLNKFHGRIDYFKKQLVAIVVLTVLSTLFFYWYPKDTNITPKTLLIIFSAIFLILWISSRLLIFYILSKKQESYLIIGNSQRAHQLFEDLSSYGPQKKKIIIYSDAFLINFDNQATQVIKPPIKNLLKTMENNRFDKIILDKNFTYATEIINLFFSEIPKMKSEFYELQDFYEKLHSKITLENLDKRWFIYNLRPGQNIYLIGKKAIDILLSTIGTGFLICFYPIIGILIKLDSNGPVIYKQKRIGQNKRVFYIYKFRTMTHSADDVQICATPNDKRVTKMGKLLRKSHLDEMPQIINVLKGDLSVVGPRPEQPKIVEQLNSQITFYNQRHLIRPGVTGWAQINYPYCTSLEEHKNKLRYDLYYLKHKSFILDLKIVLKTISKLFS